MSKGENYSQFQKGVLIIGVPLVFEMVLVLILSISVTQAAHDASVARWRQSIHQSTDALLRVVFEAFSTMISYGMDRKESTSRHFDELMLEIEQEQKHLSQLCRRDRDATQRLEHLNKNLSPALATLRKVKSERDQGAKNPFGFMSFMHKQAYFLRVLRELRTLQHDMNTPQIEMEEIARQAHHRDRIFIFAVLFLGFIGSIVLAIGVSNFFSRSLSSRLLLIAENSKRLSEKQELREAQSGKDEVADLDRKFHEMAAVLQSSADKQNEIINNSEDVICAISESGVFEVLNHAVERQWGYSPNELVKTSIRDLSPSLDGLMQDLANLKGKPSARPFDRQIPRKDGTALDTTWSCHWSEIEQCFFCVVHDISAQKERERIKALFVGLIGKQMRKPLQDIEESLKLLRNNAQVTLTAKGEKSLANSIVSTGRIIQLVDELLELERMEQGAITLNISEVSTQAILLEAFASVQSFADGRKLELCSEDGGYKLNADSKRLVQVLVNLLSNAIKYSPVSGKIIVKTENLDKRIVFSVLDEGPGIPPEALNSLFARFKRLERDIDKTVSGTGLGLSICKLIVEQHGGEIGVENNPDKGSRFWFAIPRSKRLNPVCCTTAGASALNVDEISL